MPNSDNTYGTFNKRTTICGQEINGSEQIFANVDEAKAHFFTTDALAVWNECCTNLQWKLSADKNGNKTGLKITFDFGTKGGNIAAADDWAGQYNSRKQALIDSNNWLKTHESSATKLETDNVGEHLF